MPTDQAFLDSLVSRELDDSIDTSRFECHEQIVWFLRNAARDYQSKRLASVKCWFKDGDLAGYVTTCMSIAHLAMEDQRKSLELSVPVLSTGAQLKNFPALLIGQLGTCSRYARLGLGELMVRHAIGQAFALSKQTGCRFVTVDSDLSDEAIGLYTKIGFERVQAKGKDERKTVWMFYDLRA